MIWYGEIDNMEDSRTLSASMPSVLISSQKNSFGCWSIKIPIGCVIETDRVGDNRAQFSMKFYGSFTSMCDKGILQMVEYTFLRCWFEISVVVYFSNSTIKTAPK